MTKWRDDPRLKGKFHQQCPDDIQVIIHEGGPRLAKHPPELIWVRVTDCQGEVFTGIILNQPYGLTNVRKDQIIKFLMPIGGEHPIMVSEKYLAERVNWRIYPCNNCGFAEIFDAPSDFIRVMFPRVPENEIWASYTSMCGICRKGAQVVENKNAPIPKSTSIQNKRKRWWQSWKSRS